MKQFYTSLLGLLFCLPTLAGIKADSTATANTDSIPPHRKIVELGIDEKIIYVNELGLPPNTMVYDALSMFPELLGRNTDDILGRYDVQLDDVSVGFNKYSVLAHTMISEVHHIEITTDPSVSQSTSGVGGVINIITLAVDTGLHGQVSVDVFSNFNLMPSVSLAYKKEKLTLYGSALLSYMDYNDKKNESVDDIKTNDWISYNNFYKGLSETFKFGMAYQFNKHDKLTFWLLQNLDNYKDSASKEINRIYFSSEMKTDTGKYVHGSSEIYSPRLNSKIDAILKFERLYDRPSQKLYASLAYSNNYSEDKNSTYLSGNYFASGIEKYIYSKYVSKPNNISTSLYYRFHLLPEECAHILKLKAGMNFNMGFSKGTDYSIVYYENAFSDYTQDYTLTPYVTFNYQWTKLQMELSVKYRLKVRRGRGEDSEWQDNIFNDVIGNFNITYTPVLNHQLRASTSRSINTPSSLQLYENAYYKQVDNKFYHGNSSLEEPELHNVDLQYFYQYRNRKHEFQLYAAVEYVNAKKLIVQYEYPTDYGPVVSWMNHPTTSHIVDGRISLFWQTGIFSATFGGNFYNQTRKPEGGDKYENMFYYNLLLQPVLHFEKGWTISGQFIYNSHVYNGDFTKGDAIYMDFNITKAWGPWAARLAFNNTYDYLSNDVKKSGDKEISTYYNLYSCQLMIGFTYQFHKANKTKKKDVGSTL